MKCIVCKAEMKLVKTDFSVPFNDINIMIYNDEIWKCPKCGRKIYIFNKYTKTQRVNHEIYNIKRSDKL